MSEGAIEDEEWAAHWGAVARARGRNRCCARMNEKFQGQ